MKLIPESSPLYTYSTEFSEAFPNRKPGSAIENSLQIAYRKYVRTLAGRGRKLNLLFNHGNGMNKAVWHLMIDQLYQALPYLSTVIACDLVNHGDLVVANEGKLGEEYWWLDSAKDFNHVIERQPEFTELGVVNVIVGHLMGGCIALMMAKYNPKLWSSVIAVNPVSYFTPEAVQAMEIMKDYFSQKYLDEIPTGDDWHADVILFLKKKSFYKHFPDDELNNYLFDEVNGRYDDEKLYSGIRPKATAGIQTRIYAHAATDIEEAKPMYGEITVPVYLLWGTLDPPDAHHLHTFRDMVKSLVKVIEIPDGRHLMTQENPKETFEALTKLIVDSYNQGKESKL